MRHLKYGATHKALTHGALIIAGEKPGKRVESMKLLGKPPVFDLHTNKFQETPKKPPQKREKNNLPPDEHREEIPSKHIDFDDSRHVVISVRRFGEDGLLGVDVRWFQTTDMYTGFTKKGISIPIEIFAELVQNLNDVMSECEEKGLFVEE